eukprot:jgi/Psemu1/21391/gm1.21391_g
MPSDLMSKCQGVKMSRCQGRIILLWVIKNILPVIKNLLLPEYADSVRFSLARSFLQYHTDGPARLRRGPSDCLDRLLPTDLIQQVITSPQPRNLRFLVLLSLQHSNSSIPRRQFNTKASPPLQRLDSAHTPSCGPTLSTSKPQPVPLEASWPPGTAPIPPSMATLQLTLTPTPPTPRPAPRPLPGSGYTSGKARLRLVHGLWEYPGPLAQPSANKGKAFGYMDGIEGDAGKLVLVNSTMLAQTPATLVLALDHHLAEVVTGPPRHHSYLVHMVQGGDAHMEVVNAYKVCFVPFELVPCLLGKGLTSLQAMRIIHPFLSDLRLVETCAPLLDTLRAAGTVPSIIAGDLTLINNRY